MVLASSALAKRWNDLLPKQFNGVPHHELGHPANFMVRAEDVVPDALLACFELANNCLRAANNGEAVLKVKFVALGCHTHGLAARLVVGTLTVAPHATGVRPPANARLRNGTTAYAYRTASGRSEELARLLVGFRVGLGHVHLPLQEDAGHGAGMVALLPNLAVEVELAGYDRVGVQVLGDMVVVARSEFDGCIAVHGRPDGWVRFLVRLRLGQRLIEPEILALVGDFVPGPGLLDHI